MKYQTKVKDMFHYDCISRFGMAEIWAKPLTNGCKWPIVWIGNVCNLPGG